ncbi:ABC transporter [Streptomyces sp. NPDC090106]|uniref:ABC transporter n=1 Tax=Streptomyces sp. NPDC090106 TaxID=3365946 RepID=UPI003814F225
MRLTPLLLPVLRSSPWRVIGAAGAIGLLIASVPRMSGDADAFLALQLLRVAALAFALGLAFLLDDPARHTTATVPTRRPLRQALRLALVVPLAAVWWTGALLLVPAPVRPPVGDLTLEAAACLAFALAAAAVAVRFGGAAEPGQAVAGAVLTAAVLAPLLVPERWALLVAPQDARWDGAHDRWAAVLVAAAAVWAACGPERTGR